MSERDPSFSHRTWRVWGSVEQQLREYVTDTGEVTISPSDLIQVCRSATLKAERWVGDLEGAGYLDAGESLARQLQQHYHKHHQSPSRGDNQEQYSVEGLKAIARILAGEAFRELYEQYRRRG